MALHFVSDVHLRLDRPDRSRKFADWVNSVGPDDTIYVAGDLCDFWFSSRQWRQDPRRCPGLAALIDHRRRGGRLRIVLGNHDARLGPFYRDRLGAELVDGPSETIEEFGLRIRVEHGHRAGTRNPWKGVMESEAFRHGFALVPDFAARRLESALDRSNDVHRADADARHLREFRSIADQYRESADLVLFGHSHVVHDELRGGTRLIILGDWLDGESFLRIDERGACFCADRPVLSPSSCPTTSFS